MKCQILFNKKKYRQFVLLAKRVVKLKNIVDYSKVI